MKPWLRCASIAGLIAVAPVSGSRAQSPSPAASATTSPAAAGDILAVAKAAGNFETFLKAVKAAGLTETLQGAGPFTVFAPTDEAFGRLPEGVLNTWMDPKNVDKLKATLLYHVAPQKISAAQIAKVDELKTLGPTELDVDSSADGKDVEVDDSKIVKKDVPASNGLIQVIDRVLQP